MSALDHNRKALALLRDSAAYKALSPKARPRTKLGMCEKEILAAIADLAPHPVVDYGVLDGSGWFLWSAGSGSEVEKVAAVAASPTFKYLALVIDGLNPPASWQTWRIVASQRGIPCVPWKQCLVPADVVELLEVATDWHSPGVLVNVEAESETTLPPAEVDRVTRGWHGSLGIVTDYRGYEDPGGYHGPDWSVVADRAVGFMEAWSSPAADRPIDSGAALSRLALMGFKRRVVMPSTKITRLAYSLPVTVARAPYVLDLVPADQVASWA